MARNVMKERKPDMYKAILELKDLQECMDFFEDVFEFNGLAEACVEVEFNALSTDAAEESLDVLLADHVGRNAETE